MSKRQSQPDSSHQGAKKPKIKFVFHSAVPRVTPTTNEPSSSHSTSRSTVITLSQSEDGWWCASGRHRNRQQRPSTPNDPIPEPKTLDVPDPSEGISTAVMPEPLADGIQNTTQSSKTNWKRNNNTAVSHCIFFLPGTLSNIFCLLESSPGMAHASPNVSGWNPLTQQPEQFSQPVNLLCLQEAGQSL